MLCILKLSFLLSLKVFPFARLLCWCEPGSGWSGGHGSAHRLCTDAHTYTHTQLPWCWCRDALGGRENTRHLYMTACSWMFSTFFIVYFKKYLLILEKARMPVGRGRGRKRIPSTVPTECRVRGGDHALSWNQELDAQSTLSPGAAQSSPSSLTPQSSECLRTAWFLLSFHRFS